MKSQSHIQVRGLPSMNVIKVIVGKSLGPRGLLPLWSQVRALWLLI